MVIFIRLLWWIRFKFAKRGTSFHAINALSTLRLLAFSQSLITRAAFFPHTQCEYTITAQPPQLKFFV